MTTEDFKQQLILKLAHHLSTTLIHLGDESIDYGMDEYIQNGYITIDFKDVLVVTDADNIDVAPDKINEFKKMGLDWYDISRLRNKAWMSFVEHLEDNGWESSTANVNDKWQYIVFMPSTLYECAICHKNYYSIILEQMER